MSCIICVGVGGGGSGDGAYLFCCDNEHDNGSDVSCAIYGGVIEYASSFSLRLVG